MLDNMLVILAVAAVQLSYQFRSDEFIPCLICYVIFFLCIFVLIDRVKEGK